MIAFDYDNKINEQKLDKSSFSKIDNNIFLDNNRTESGVVPGLTSM